MGCLSAENLKIKRKYKDLEVCKTNLHKTSTVCRHVTAINERSHINHIKIAAV